MVIELKYASIPRLRGIPIHYWFVSNDANGRVRWEVWHEPNVGAISNGHLHRDLKRPDSTVAGGPTRLARVWTGAEARQIAYILRESWEYYPHRHFYRAAPGPNSNTYVAWVLRQAGIEYKLSWRAIGKNFALRK